jgi:hypothetical protein
LGGKGAAVQETAAEVVKGVAAAAAAPPAVGQTVEFSVFALRTKALVVFPAKIQKEPPGAFFRECHRIKGDYVYFGHAVRCQIAKVFMSRKGPDGGFVTFDDAKQGIMIVLSAIFPPIKRYLRGLLNSGLNFG